jgi:hypothetical protein
MQSINAAAYEGAHELLEDLSPSDTVQLTTFNNIVHQGQILSKMAAKEDFKPGKCGGLTALYDAICMSIESTLERFVWGQEGQQRHRGHCHRRV